MSGGCARAQAIRGQPGVAERLNLRPAEVEQDTSDGHVDAELVAAAAPARVTAAAARQALGGRAAAGHADVDQRALIVPGLYTRRRRYVGPHSPASRS